MFGVLRLGKLGASMRRAGFNPSTLFAASEPGAWYDPSDMSTMFQDSAGTTPVTAVEQPVGRILDKSGRGNHATQPTTTKRPIYSRRVNLLTESEFRNGVADAPIRGGLVSASTMAGYLGAIAVGAEGDNYVYKTVAGLGNTQVVVSIVVRMEDGSAPRVSLFSGPSNDFLFIVEGVGYTPAQQELAPGIYRLSVTTTIVSSGTVYLGAFKQAEDSTRTFKVTAYDLRLAIDAHLPYQWVNTATDYDADPAKFPGYLRFDGIDDAMVTGNIDFTGTDKMTVWAGVTKLSDAGLGIVSELSGSIGSNNGTFILAAPANAGPTMQFASRGTIIVAATEGTIPSPASRVMCGYADIAGESCGLRINGGNIVITYSQGTGNYGNYPLYIGARAAAYPFFNGRIYSLIVRGAQSSLSQIEAAELYTRRRMMLP